MKGFNNMGNTCYLNAGLQMIILNLDLCNLVLKYSQQSIILNKIAIIISEYYNSSNHSSITPLEIKKIVEQRQNIFYGCEQQDSFEFIICLLNIIDEEIKKITNTNEIENIFGIKLNVRIKCKYNTCLNISNTTEISNFLILDIDQDCSTLDDLYRKFKSSEILCSDNQYFCKECNTKRNASKRNQVINWPNYLFINLKRFKQNGNSVTKQNQHINIDISWRHEMNLIGAVIHYGNINGGHYVYVGKISNNWYLFNDNNISEIKSDNELNNILNFAYILAYKKQQLSY
jgi:ubiquitin C-terminal hydrolase